MLPTMTDCRMLVVAQGGLRAGEGTSLENRERVLELLQLCGASPNASAVAVTGAGRSQDYTNSAGRDCSEFLTVPVLEPTTIREPDDPTHEGWADQLGLIRQYLNGLAQPPKTLVVLARLSEAEAFMARSALRHEKWHLELIQADSAGGVNEPVGDAIAKLLGVPRPRVREGDYELVNVPSGLAAGMQATENSIQKIEAEFGLLDDAQLADLLRAKGSPRSFATDQRNKDCALSIPRLNAFVYPGFQFDRDTGAVTPVIPQLIELGTSYGWTPADIALWLCAPTTYLPEDGRPVDFLDDSALVFDVAQRAWGVEW